MDRTSRMIPDWFRRHCLQAGFVAVWVGMAPVAAVAATGAEDVPAGDQSTPALEVTIEDGLVTLRADGASLAEVLQAVGDAGALRVILNGELATPVHDTFSAQPLDRAIRRLVGDRTLVMMREPVGQGGAPALAEVRVVGDDAGTQTSGEPAEKPVARGSARPSPAPPDDQPPTLDVDWPRTKENILLELRDVEPEVRMAAVLKTASLSTGEAYGVLSEVFADEEDMLVRSRGVAAATRLDGRTRAALLQRQAMHDEDPELRMQALNALAASEERRVAPTLGHIVRFDPEPQVRLTAVHALQRIGGDRARSYLEVAVEDWDPELGEAAKQVLAGWPDESQ